MSASDYNATDPNKQITKDDYQDLVKQAEEVLVSISNRLTNVSVTVGKGSTDIIVAIQKVFGNKYIKADGSSEITFEMFQHLTEAIRKVGVSKVEEYI